MKKSSVLLIMLLLALGLCLTACGNNNQPDGNNEHVHSFGDWEITHNPTCVQSGAKVRYCDCGEKQTEVVPATDLHTEVVDPAVEPTCTETGLTEGKHCSVCGLVTVAQSVLQTIAHTEVTDVAVAPTCTETGLTEGNHCSVCQEVLVQQDVIPALEHVFATNYSFDNSFHWYSCKACDDVKDKAEHQLTDDGICTICDQTIDTVGIIYDVSDDGTYAMVTGYTGTATKIRIAETYQGLPVTTIYEEAFYNIYTITSVIIPDSVTTIGVCAFQFCDSLTSVVIPDSVTTIGESAFICCYKLKDVYYTGSEKEWNAIAIGPYNYNLTNATRHYNYVPQN